MFRVLYAAPLLAYPPAGGPEMDIDHSVKALSKISELHIVSTMPQVRTTPAAERYFSDKSAAFHYSPSARSGVVASIGRRLRSMAGLTLLNADVDWMLSYYRRHAMDVIWCDRGEELSVELIHGLKAKDRTARVVCDTCAVYSQF